VLDAFFFWFSRFFGRYYSVSEVEGRFEKEPRENPLGVKEAQEVVDVG
jgi:hypothetical protein